MLLAKHAEVRKQLDEYISNGWIQPSISLYGAPIVFAREKDSS